MAHDLVDDVEVALSHGFCLLRERGDRLLAPFFQQGTIIVIRRKLEIVRNLGRKVGGAGGQDMAKNGLAGRPFNATLWSDIRPTRCHPQIS